MEYAIELFFDRKTTTLIRVIWHKVEETGAAGPLTMAGMRPHLTVSGFKDPDTGEVASALRGFARETPALAVSFASLGTFSTREGVVFLAPVMSRQLLLLHEQLHRRLKDCVKRVESYYAPASWVPHCTVAQGLDRRETAMVIGLFSRKALPINGRVEKIALVDTRNGEIRCQYALQGASN